MNLVHENNIVLIIGIGNEFRGDDAAGLLVARRLRKILPENFKIVETSGEGIELLELWKFYATVYIIDAVNSKNIPGKIYRFDVHSQKPPFKFFNYSSHSFSLAEAVEVGRKLNQLPSNLIIYGIEGKNFYQGIGISKDVDDVLNIVVNKIQNELKGLPV